MKKFSYDKPKLVRLNEVAAGQAGPSIPPPITPPPLPQSCASGSIPTSSAAAALSMCNMGTTAGTACTRGYSIV